MKNSGQLNQKISLVEENEKFNVQKIRQDFPILGTQVYGKSLVYLDNAASTQKPKQVIEAINHCYSKEYANVHRGVHYLSEKATLAYEKVRKTVQKFINAPSFNEIVFVRGTTEGINLVAHGFEKAFVNTGDEIIISAMEHHSNIVPWQMLCENTGAVLKVIPMNQKGELLLDQYEKLLSPKTRLVSIVHVSNALGTINPVKEMIAMAHKQGIPVLLDGAQAVAHLPVDVQDLDCDFYTFSGHKLFGPTGIGVLYGKEKWLNKLPPYQGGGDMIRSVTFEKTTYNDIPYKFEAGTPHIAGVIGLGAAIDYVSHIGFKAIESYEQELLEYGNEVLSKIPGVKFVGTAKHKCLVWSMSLDHIHPHDIATILDHEGIAVRAGHHCAQPVMDFFGVSATVRASLTFYNTKEEIDTLASGLKKVMEVFK